jgi:hypothetical protein
MSAKRQLKQIEIGQQYGRLVVIAPAMLVKRHSFWLCACACGNTKAVRQDSLRNGITASCGCLARERTRARTRKHGMAGHNRPPEYDAWAHMIRRCYTPTTKAFEHYGGRGITVCQRWRDSFEAFLADMGPRPSAKHSLDRINNDGNYEPSNCRWATTDEQARNTRRNVKVTFRGETKTVAEWGRALGFPREVLRRRIAVGWPVELALTLPADAAMSRRAMNQVRSA